MSFGLVYGPDNYPSYKYVASLSCFIAQKELEYTHLLLAQDEEASAPDTDSLKLRGT